jgi:hypothetical protein
MTMHAPCSRARWQWDCTSFTLTMTEWVTSPRRRRAALVAHVADDHGPLTEAELSAVILTDPDTLEKPEGCAEPIDGLAHVGVDEDGNDGGLGDRAIVSQLWHRH